MEKFRWSEKTEVKIRTLFPLMRVPDFQSRKLNILVQVHSVYSPYQAHLKKFFAVFSYLNALTLIVKEYFKYIKRFSISHNKNLKPRSATKFYLILTLCHTFLNIFIYLFFKEVACYKYD